jgi:hypothetical protein
MTLALGTQRTIARSLPDLVSTNGANLLKSCFCSAEMCLKITFTIAILTWHGLKWYIGWPQTHFSWLKLANLWHVSQKRSRFFQYIQMEYDIAPEASAILKTWSQEVKPAGLGHKAHNEVTIVLRGIINFNGQHVITWSITSPGRWILIKISQNYKGVSENTPFYPMVLLIIIPIFYGYFIGKINP